MRKLLSGSFTLLLFVTLLPSYSYTDKELEEYSANARQKISANWTKQKPENLKAIQDIKSPITVKFSFEIKKDGSIQNLKITESSKIKELDDKALTAVKSSLPFSNLPKGLDVLSIGYGFRFDPPVVLKKMKKGKNPFLMHRHTKKSWMITIKL